MSKIYRIFFTSFLCSYFLISVKNSSYLSSLLILCKYIYQLLNKNSIQLLRWFFKVRFLKISQKFIVLFLLIFVVIFFNFFTDFLFYFIFFTKYKNKLIISRYPGCKITRESRDVRVRGSVRMRTVQSSSSVTRQS